MKKFVPLDGSNAPANYGQDYYYCPNWSIFDKQENTENVILDDYSHDYGRPVRQVN